MNQPSTAISERFPVNRGRRPGRSTERLQPRKDRRWRSTRAGALTVVGVLVLASCGGGSDPDEAAFCDTFDEVESFSAFDVPSDAQIEQLRVFADDLASNSPGDISSEVDELANQLRRSADAGEELMENPEDENRIFGELLAGVPNDFEEQSQTIEFWTTANCGAARAERAAADGDSDSDDGGSEDGGDGFGLGSTDSATGGGDTGDTGASGDTGADSNNSGDGSTQSDSGSGSGDDSGQIGLVDQVVIPIPAPSSEDVDGLSLPITFVSGTADFTVERVALQNYSGYEVPQDGEPYRRWVHVEMSGANTIDGWREGYELGEAFLTDGDVVLTTDAVRTSGGAFGSGMFVSAGERLAGEAFSFPYVEELDWSNAQLVFAPVQGARIALDFNEGEEITPSLPYEIDGSGTGTWSRVPYDPDSCDGGVFTTTIESVEIDHRRGDDRPPAGFRYLRARGTTTATSATCVDRPSLTTARPDRSIEVDGKRYEGFGWDITERMEVGETVEEAVVFEVPIDAEEVVLAWGGQADETRSEEFRIELDWSEVEDDFELTPTTAFSRGQEVPNWFSQADDLGLEYFADDIDEVEIPTQFTWFGTEVTLERVARTNLDQSRGSFVFAEQDRILMQMSAVKGLRTTRDRNTELGTGSFLLSDGSIELGLESLRVTSLGFDEIGLERGGRDEGIMASFIDNPAFDWSNAHLVVNAGFSEFPEVVSLTEGGSVSPYPVQFEDAVGESGTWVSTVGTGFLAANCPGQLTTEITEARAFLDSSADGRVDPDERWVLVRAETTGEQSDCEGSDEVGSSMDNRLVEIDGRVFAAEAIAFEDTVFEGKTARETMRFQVPFDASVVALVWGTEDGEQFRVELDWDELSPDGQVG